MREFLTREKGQGLVEYALILVLVAIVVIGILLVLGPTVGEVFSDIVAHLQGSGVITSVTAERPSPTSNSVKVTITVSTNTSVTVRDSQSGKTGTDTNCNGSCTITLDEVGGSAGRVTVRAAAGGIVTASYPSS